MSFVKTGNKAVAPPSRTANRSRVMAARMRSVLNTKRNPASSDFSVTSSDRCITGFGLIGTVMAALAAEKSAASMYTHIALPEVSQRPIPPSAGPTTEAICQPLLVQVTALVSTSSGTMDGTSDQRAGELNACPTPTTAMQT